MEPRIKKALKFVIDKAEKSDTFKIKLEDWPKSLKVTGFDEANEIYRGLLDFFNGFNVSISARDYYNDSSYFQNCLRMFSIGIDENNDIDIKILPDTELGKNIFVYAIKRMVLGELK